MQCLKRESTYYQLCRIEKKPTVNYEPSSHEKRENQANFKDCLLKFPKRKKKTRRSLLNRSAENCQKYGILLTGKSEADLR